MAYVSHSCLADHFRPDFKQCSLPTHRVLTYFSKCYFFDEGVQLGHNQSFQPNHDFQIINLNYLCVFRKSSNG